jgi:hypothetical protein
MPRIDKTFARHNILLPVEKASWSSEDRGISVGKEKQFGAKQARHILAVHLVFCYAVAIYSHSIPLPSTGSKAYLLFCSIAGWGNRFVESIMPNRTPRHKRRNTIKQRKRLEKN